MQRICLLILTVFLTVNQLHAQNNDVHGRFSANRWQMMNEIENVVPLAPKPLKKPASRGSLPTSQAVSLISIGSSPNIFTSAFGPRTNIYADPAVNSVMMVFRSNPASTGDPNSGYLRYSYSTNGGSSWTNNAGPLYIPNGTTLAQARYPQCAIYNPPGNTSAGNAFATAFAPTISGNGNGGWGGHGYSGKLLNVSGTPQAGQDTNSAYLIPDGGAMNMSDKSFWISNGMFDALTGKYNDTILLGKGVWSAGRYNYSYQKIPFPIDTAPDGSKRIEATNIAWGSGGTGYFAMLCHDSYQQVPQLNYYPVIFKTTDNGLTWTKVAVINMNSFSGFFQSGSYYTTGFDFDLAVDINNNLHIITAAGRTGVSPFTLDDAFGQWGMFDLATTDGGTTWKARLLGFPQSYSGAWFTNTTLVEYNRPQISRTADGSKLFFVWFETDSIASGTGENTDPDVHIAALNVATGLWKNNQNMTTGSPAELLCKFGNVSPYTLLNSSTGCHKIPISVTDFINTFNDPVEHFYLSGVEICNSEFTSPANTFPLINFTFWSGNINGPALNCAGNINTYSVDPLPGATNYTWTLPPGSTILSGQGDTLITALLGNTSGPITVVASDNLSDLGFAIKPLNILPIEIFVTANNTAICRNSTGTTLTASGGQSYTWSPALGLNATTGPSVIASPPYTTTYTVTGTSSNGCTRSTEITITVLPSPNVTVTTSGATSFCEGDSVVISSSAPGAIAYQWRRNNVNILGATDSIYTASVSGNYRVVATNPNGCTTLSLNTTVNVNANPIIGFNASPSTTLCGGGIVNLSGTGGVTYQWSNGITDSIDFTANSSSTYSVIGTDANGCTGTATASISVVQNPVISISGNNSICISDTAILTANGAQTYEWTPFNTLSSDTGSTVFALPGSTTTYTVVGKDSSGCFGSSTIQVTVGQRPTISTSGGGVIICEGTSTPISATGGVSYSWSPVIGLSNSTGSPVLASPTTNTIYTVIGTGANGCTNTATANIQVRPKPNIGYNAFPSNEVCGPNTITLSGTGGTNYQWTGGIVDGQSFLAISSTSYTVTGTGTNGCSATATVNVGVNDPPVILFQGNPTICKGDSTTIIATGATSYTWSPAIGLSSTTEDTVRISPPVTTTYKVIGVNGCIDSTIVTINVNSLPIVGSSGPSSICYGNNATLTANGALTYTWSPATGLSSTTGSTVIASPDSTITYTVTGTDGNGCKRSTDIPVTVNPLPTIGYNAFPSNEFCGSGQLTLSGSGGVSYQWSGGVVNAQPFTVNSSANYTVTGTDANGCTNTATANIGVNTVPNLVVTGTRNICLGDSTSLTASGATNYTWSPAIGLDTTAGANVIAAPAANTSYTLTGNNGCTASINVNITVNPLPPVSAGSNTDVCFGKSKTLTATGAATYTWSPTTGLNTGSGGSVISTPDSTITYIVTGTSTPGCVNSDTITLTVLPLPDVFTVATDTICAGKSKTITASGAATYSWSPGTGLSSTTGSVVTASPANSIAYTVTGTDGNGCTNTSTTIITVNPNPLVNAGLDRSICVGENTILSATGAVFYQWTPSTGLSSVISPTVNASPSSTVSYVVTGTDINGCTSTANVTVTVNPLPNVFAGPGGSICFGDSVQLSAAGANSYLWAPTTGLSSGSGSSVSASPIVNTTYVVTGTDSNGCVNSSSFNLNVIQRPVVDASSNVSICAGNSTVLSATGAINYVWSPIADLSVPIGSPVTASPPVTRTYTVVGSGTGGCTASDSVIVTVRNLPNTSISGNTGVCPGDSTTLNVTGGQSFVWSPASGLSDTTASSVVVTPGGTSTYYVTGTASNGCTNTDSVTVTVYSLPSVGAVALPNDTVCVGQLIRLLGSGASSYIWSDGVTNGQSFALQTGGTYTVTGTDSNGCVNQTSIQVDVQAYPLPQSIAGDTLVNALQNYTYTVNNVPGIQFTWIVTGGSLISGQGTSSASVLWGATPPLALSLIQSSSFGCNDTVTIAITPVSLAGISQPSDPESIVKVYPNPATNNLNVVFNSAGERTIRIGDSSGRMLREWNVNDTFVSLSLEEGFSSGIYLLSVIQESKATQVLRIMIETGR